MKKNHKWAFGITLAVIIAVFAFFYINPVEASEGAYMAITVYYSDGTSRTYSPGLRHIGLDFIDPNNNKMVIRIETALHIVTDFEGAVNSYTVSGQYQWQLYDGSTNTLISNLGSAKTISYAGGILTSDQDVTVLTDTMDTAGASTGLVTMYSGWIDNKEYFVTLTSTQPLSVTLNFGETPTPITRQVTPLQVQWKVRYEYPYAFNSLSASWSGYMEYSPYV